MEPVVRRIADAALELRDFIDTFDEDDLTASDILCSDEYVNLKELVQEYEEGL